MKKGNVANQREHLILLLANIDVRKKNPREYGQVSHHSFETLSIYLFKFYALELLDNSLNLHPFLITTNV